MNRLREYWHVLKGYKTYMVVAFVFIISGMRGIGAMDEETFQVIMSLLGGAGLFTVRHGMKTKA